MEMTFPAYLVRRDEGGQVRGRVESLRLDDLPAGDVVVRVVYSSVNYKDALAASGHPGVAKSLPHVPGIDAAGTVAASQSKTFRVGDPVIVTGYSMGEDRFGGWAGMVRVPADFVVPLPDGLSLREAMIYGTAGFTAAQSVWSIVDRQIDPQRGPVVVTGASGGVGSLSVALLARCGYRVVAVSGKPEAERLLKKLGAAEVAPRDAVDDSSARPLLRGRWSAAIDTVGGNILSTILRSTMHRAVVTCCGLVAGADLPITVYPFILRGVNLVGIDSAQCPMGPRISIWSKLASEWKLDLPEDLVEETDLHGVSDYVEKILAGQVRGRVLVKPGS